MSQTAVTVPVPFSSAFEHLNCILQPNRSNSVVLDPFVFIDNSRGFLEWFPNYDGKGLYYRQCSDLDLKLPRQTISDWSSIVYCDYKIYLASLSVPEQHSQLLQWLNMPIPQRILHISIDDVYMDFVQAITHLALTQFKGDLAVQIFDRTHTARTASELQWCRDQFPIDQLLCLDYYKHNKYSKHRYYVDLITQSPALSY